MSLLAKLRHVYAGGEPAKYLVPDDALPAFMLHCEARIGDSYFRTPRTTIRAFIDLLSVLDQNPDADWQTLLGNLAVARDMDSDDAEDRGIATDIGAAGAPLNGRVSSTDAYSQRADIQPSNGGVDAYSTTIPLPDAEAKPPRSNTDDDEELASLRLG